MERLQAEGSRTCAAKLAVMVERFLHSVRAPIPAMFSFLLLVQHGHAATGRAEDMQDPGQGGAWSRSPGAMARGEISLGEDLEVATAMVLGIVLQPATFKVYGHISAAH